MSTPIDPREIGRAVAATAAMLEDSDEFKAVVNSAARAIRAERRGCIRLTKGEAQAALDAIGQMTFGNARDYSSWKMQTSGSVGQWLALLRAEAKIAERLNP